MQTSTHKLNPIVGRFAPTPSGPLHFGSLVAALGSYLIAKSQLGHWLVRIENLDPPREKPGAASDILKTLERLGFEWDGPVVYQSARTQFYREALFELHQQGRLYFCDCSRAQVEKRNQGIYDGYCRQRRLFVDALAAMPIESGARPDAAIRIQYHPPQPEFEDHILGRCHFDNAEDLQDFVVLRRDGWFAYQLAVVVDDIEQGVTQIVRGADILDSTPRQNFLYQCFKQPIPDYYHLPLVVDQNGQKFSKSRLSPAIDLHQASQWLCRALTHLGQTVPIDLDQQTPSQILAFATKQWQTSAVGRVAKIYNPY